MSTMDRRSFLRRGAAAVGGGLVAAGPMQALVARAAAAKGQPGGRGAAAAGKLGYGPLGPVAAQDTGDVLLHLPEGFHYRVIGEAGSMMSDGEPTPINHDGMASFDIDTGRIRMVRNHEVLPLDDPGQSAFGTSVMTPYDPQGPGGTTTLELTPQGEVLGSWVSQNGTTMNCAGGKMPWGAWITCEENANGPDANTNFLGQTLDLTEPHGYIFEVPISRGPGEDPSPPIRAAGRFNHEAVAWGGDGRLYLTEDNFDGPSGFYRYLPPAGNDPVRDGTLRDGGTLEVLVVHAAGKAPTAPTGAADLRGEIGAGTSFATSWVQIPVPDPVPGSFELGAVVPIPAGYTVMENHELPPHPSNTQMSRAVALQGHGLGAGNFSRIEGCWYGDGKIFFNATSGGGAPAPGRSDTPIRRGTGFGQVWMYDISDGTLTLIFESSGDDELNGPDNIVFSPQGALLICEDADTDNYLRGLTVDGNVFDFALNVTPGINAFGDPNVESEWAGVNFNDNGNVVFVNLQDITLPHMAPGAVGTSLAIWGPFRRGAL